jgi:hypothetical protein
MISLRERQQTFARTLGIFMNWMALEGYLWALGDAWRSSDKLLCPDCGSPLTYQELLANNGRSKVRYSKHNDRLAIDLILYTKDGAIAPEESYRPLAEKWESLGGRAGFRFGIDPKDYAIKAGWDPGHFEGL